MKLPLNQIIQGDCLEKLKELPENSVDSVVTDPPAGISFMGKEWDNKGDLQGFQDFICQVFIEIKRVLKPGGHALVWAIPRTSHHTAMGIERAGFEIRDCVYHVFGSGFPKSLNIGKAVDKLQGNKRIELGDYKMPDGTSRNFAEHRESSGEIKYGHNKGMERKITKGNSEWEGWGTALKPAVECWWLCRKPLSEKTVALNTLKWGTGGINVDGSRVEIDKEKENDNRVGTDRIRGDKEGLNSTSIFKQSEKGVQMYKDGGRFPANLIHDGSDEVVSVFPNTKTGAVNQETNNAGKFYGGGYTPQRNSDEGSAARFFYCAKASKSERNEGLEEFEKVIRSDRDESLASGDMPQNRSNNPKANHHPTVKPLALMEYLIKMVTPPKGIVLDPFTGSGSTLVAAKRLGFNFIGIEKEAEYVKIAEARLSSVRTQKTLI